MSSSCRVFEESSFHDFSHVIVRGILDFMALSPPLIITHTETDQLFDAVQQGLDKL